MIALRLVLPFPPSLNHYWKRTGGRSGMHISEAGKAYLVAVQAEVLTSHRGVRLTGRLDVTLALTMPDRKRRDIDNFAKVALDAITKSGLWEDDSQLDRLEIVRLGVKSPGGAELLVRELC